MGVKQVPVFGDKNTYPSALVRDNEFGVGRARVSQLAFGWGAMTRRRLKQARHRLKKARHRLKKEVLALLPLQQYARGHGTRSEWMSVLDRAVGFGNKLQCV
ncbi:MAG TPA: hypothetical protein ENI62_08055 [Gammaproteobacteria bacterium]|nr:hypothetical protein [Gammaproteobacteria bacterium]